MYSSLQVQVCWCMEPSMLRTEADAVNFNLITELIGIFWPIGGPRCNTSTNQSQVNVNFFHHQEAACQSLMGRIRERKQCGFSLANQSESSLGIGGISYSCILMLKSQHQKPQKQSAWGEELERVLRSIFISTFIA